MITNPRADFPTHSEAWDFISAPDIFRGPSDIAHTVKSVTI
jgi:hypothetical protein